MVTGVELSEVKTTSVLVESLDILIKPDILTSDSGYTLRSQDNTVDSVLRYEITPCCASLDEEL